MNFSYSDYKVNIRPKFFFYKFSMKDIFDKIPTVIHLHWQFTDKIIYV